MEHWKNFSIENIEEEKYDGVLYKEEWMPISGYEHLYHISSFGRVKSISKWCRGFIKPDTIMKQIFGDKKGYLKVNLLHNSIRRTFRVHRMTAFHFCNNKEGCNVVNHLNFKVRDNFYKNLEWTTPKGNIEHYFEFGEVKRNKGSEVPNSILTESDIPKIRQEFFINKKTRLQISAMFGVKKQTITDVISKRSWKHIL